MPEQRGIRIHTDTQFTRPRAPSACSYEYSWLQSRAGCALDKYGNLPHANVTFKNRQVLGKSKSRGGQAGTYIWICWRPTIGNKHWSFLFILLGLKKQKPKTDMQWLISFFYVCNWKQIIYDVCSNLKSHFTGIIRQQIYVRNQREFVIYFPGNRLLYPSIWQIEGMDRKQFRQNKTESVWLDSLITWLMSAKLILKCFLLSCLQGWLCFYTATFPLF